MQIQFVAGDVHAAKLTARTAAPYRVLFLQDHAAPGPVSQGPDITSILTVHTFIFASNSLAGSKR
jgi:hypothetical protein